MNGGGDTSPDEPDVTIGVLALQGDVREHTRALSVCGAQVRRVRRPRELDGLDGLVIPGGESTTMSLLLDSFELREPVLEALRSGLPAYGSCAGMILLADRVDDAAAGQRSLGGLDITVRRNGFGRQVDSFEEDLPWAGAGADEGVMRAVFIRAPRVVSVGDGVEVLARRGDGEVVAVASGGLVATSFHPEVTGDVRVHAELVARARSRARAAS